MIKLKIGNKNINVDGVNFEMDVAPFLNDSRTFVPLRFVAEGMGHNVLWLNDTQEVVVYDRKKYFDTVNACAYDWAIHWNCLSIALFKELSGVIYKDDNGYYWDNVRMSKADNKDVVFNAVEVKKGVAFIHSHGGGEHWNTKSMSKTDTNMSKTYNRRLYMVDSGGCLWFYDPTEEKPKQTLVAEGLPKDSKYYNIDNANMQEYFTTGYHDLNDFDFGFKADYYNKLYMNGEKYYER